MKPEKVFLRSSFYFECPVTGAVIIDEENEISNRALNATEFIYYDGESEFSKKWVVKTYIAALINFIELESKDTKNVICYELVIGSRRSYDNLFIGNKN